MIWRTWGHTILPGSTLLGYGQNAVATWHKFANPGSAISTKNSIFPIQGAQFWLKMSYFQPRGQDFDQICPIYNPGGTILTKNVILPTPVPCGMILAKFIIKYILNT